MSLSINLKLASTVISTEKFTAGLLGQQPQAFEAVANAKKGDIILIRGYAGTGKSTVVGRIIDYLMEQNREKFILDRDTIFVGAPTHQAKKVLRSKISGDDISVSTMHSGMAMKQVNDEHGNVRFVPEAVQGKLFGGKPPVCDVERADLVVAEECSMYSSYMGGILMDMWRERRFTLVLVGDSAQIPPVDDKKSYFFSEQFSGIYHHEVVLNDIIRQGANSPIIDLATEIRNNLTLSARKMLDLVHDYADRANDAGFVKSVSNEDMRHLIATLYCSDSYEADHSYAKCIAYNRSRAELFSTRTRELRTGTENTELLVDDLIIFNGPYDLPVGSIQNNDEFKVESLKRGELYFYNKVFDCTYATLTDIYDGKRYENIAIPLRAELPNIARQCQKVIDGIKRIGSTSERKQAWAIYYATLKTMADVQPLYGITAHRSQGNTYQNAIVDVRNIMNVKDTDERNRILYTAVTRAANGLYVKLK